MDQFKCPRCGRTDTYYDHSKRALRCAGCGYEVNRSVKDEEQMKLDNAVYLAAEHNRVGHWDEAIRLLTPLTLQHPSDTRIYHAIVVAATKGFSDPDMLDSNRRKTAAEAWDSLLRLNAVTSDMNDYRRSIMLKKQSRSQAKTMHIIGWLFLAAFVSIIAAIFFVTAHYFLTFLMSAGVIGCIVMAFLVFVGNIEDYRSEREEFPLNPFYVP